MKLAVLNPGGRDREQHFPDGAGAPDAKGHPPVNYHAYAACTRGGFFQETSALPTGQKNVLLVLRRDLNACLTSLTALKSAGKIVAVTIKESGAHQVADLLRRAKNAELFQKICRTADGALASTPDLAEIYRAAGAVRAEFVPTPYPIDDARWDFSIPPAERRGVLIGTREFDVPSRNHAAALLVAHAFGEPVTVLNTTGRAGRKDLARLAIPRLEIVEGPLPYPRYLALVARHKMVFQLDRSSVPGQIAGDALLCGIPCVGGDSALERVAFPAWCGHGRDFVEIAQLAKSLLTGEAAHEAGARAREAAQASVSFSAIAARLERFFTSLT